MRVYLPLCPYPSLSGPLEDETTTTSTTVGGTGNRVSDLDAAT
jgi:hypothetical protein